MGILASGQGLLAVSLPRPTQELALSALEPKGAEFDQRFFFGLTDRLADYFKGVQVEFPDALDLSGATPFQTSVWQAARKIPWGETRSYGWLAAKIGKPEAPRAVGNALGRNPLPIIVPCHRILAANGGLGGFTGGLDMKRALLGLEKNKI